MMRRLFRRDGGQSRIPGIALLDCIGLPALKWGGECGWWLNQRAAGAALRENSAVLLKCQMAAPVPMTATRMRRVSRRPRQDFIVKR